MRKLFPAVLGAVILFFGLAIASGPSVLRYDSLTVYQSGKETVYGPGCAPLCLPSGGAVRVECKSDPYDALAKLSAKEIWREKIDDSLTVVYAYSERFVAFETVHGKRVNVMLSVRNGRDLSIGVPLLMGSY